MMPRLTAKIAQILSFLLLLSAPSHAADLYVAPTGDDANPGTQSQPFATLPRAMAAVRQLESAIAQHRSPAAPVNVFLRGGTYALTKPIVFTPADSGTAAAPITYASAPGERAVLSGGTSLTGTWTPTPGKPFFQLDLPAARDGKWVFYSLFVNGQSRTRARTPNYGEKLLRAEGREPGGDPRQALRYFPGDVDPSWSNPTDIDVVLLCSWTPTLHRVKEIDAQRCAVRFYSAHDRVVDFWERNFRYYISNVFEALDEPGEWYLNRHTGTLYYYPLPGEDLSKIEVVAPVMKSRLISFDADLPASRFIEHLHFRDLNFQYLDGDMDAYNGMYRQGHMYLASAIGASGLRHASFERCELSQLGEYAMALADGCQDVTVRQCHIWDLGAGALQLGVTDLPTLLKPLDAASPARGAVDPRREVRGLVIDNNCIHRIGTVWHGCYGIVNRFASLSRITHNEIYDTHWIAIGLDARWTWKGEPYSHGNEIAYNHLHDLGLRYHSDAAAVYQFGPLDTHIHHNLIHDTVTYPYNCGFAGVYLDEQSRGALVENNLVYNVEWYAYFQHKGMDNVFRNNIGAFARNGFIGRGGLDKVWPSNTFEVTRNIYISRDGLAVERGFDRGPKPSVVNGNMYTTLAQGTPLTFGGKSFAQGTPLTFGGKSFAQWQASGWDTQSRVGDPGCRNPAAFDFSLAPDAPACKAVGFVPFDAEIKKAGLYGAAAWSAIAQAYPPRKPSAEWTEEEFSRFNAFDIDFNLMKDGSEPPVFRLSAVRDSGFAVTSEVPGVAGPKCLKVTDRKGLSKNFYPYMHFSPRGLNHGKITFTFAVSQPATGAARLSVDMRGTGSPEPAGPGIAIGRDGVIKAGRETIGKLQPGAWTRFELRITLGEGNKGTYTLVTQTGSAPATTQTLPFGSPAFKDIGWLGFTMPDDADGTVYLDALKMKIE